MSRIIAFFTCIATVVTAWFNLLTPIKKSSDVPAARGVCSFYKLYKNLEAWETRKESLTRHTLDKFKLDLAKAMEEPDGKAAFAPRIHDEEAGIVIERFYTETIPGYYLAANIYVSADPAVNQSPMPLIMLSHGHFNQGWNNRDRFFEDIQLFGAAFAQRGFLVVAWDMVGQGDDRISESESILPHGSKYNTVIQSWNSMRLLSYVLSERFTQDSSYRVDERYIAATGASGGGTQAIYSSMFDQRLTASIPVVMVSAFFNGGCECENGINALDAKGFESNICERIAFFAPKPLLIISDGEDWTRRNPFVEYPYLRYVYSFYGAKAKVENFHDMYGLHDYSLAKRQHTLEFLLRQWELPQNGVYDIPYTKGRFSLKTAETLSTFSSSSGLTRPADYCRDIEALYAIVTS